MVSPQLLLIGGRSGAGKTTVAARAFDLLSARDVKHAWIEGDFLDLAHPSPASQALPLAAQNLQAVWANYSRSGYHRLIYSNTACVLPGPSRAVISALGGKVEVAAVLLRASDATVKARLAEREEGRALAAHLQRSSSAALHLDAEAPPAVWRLDTDGRTATAIASDIVDSLDWG